MTKDTPVCEMSNQTYQSRSTLLLQFLNCYIKMLFSNVWSFLKSVIWLMLLSFLLSLFSFILGLICSLWLFIFPWGFFWSRSLVVMDVVNNFFWNSWSNVGYLILVEFWCILEHVPSNLINSFLYWLLNLNQMFILFDLISWVLILGCVEDTLISKQLLPFLLSYDFLRWLLASIKAKRSRI